MIPVDKLLALFEQMLAEHWAYVKDSAARGKVDCSGAFSWAFRELGGYIFHGANTIARKYVGTLRPASEAQPGWAVFKWRDPSEDMPAEYRHDGKGDFYHIGLCSRDGTQVLNAKSEKSGFCSDPLSAWAYAAPLLAVDYITEGIGHMDALFKAIVATQKDPLRIRNRPNTGDVIGHAPKGATVEVLQRGDWPLVRYKNLVGYVSTLYLQGIADGSQTPQTSATGAAGNTVTVTIPRDHAAELHKALAESLSVTPGDD